MMPRWGCTCQAATPTQRHRCLFSAKLGRAVGSVHSGTPPQVSHTQRHLPATPRTEDQRYGGRSCSVSTLLGIDAPKRVEATIVEATQEGIALAELVREAQSAAAVAKQQLEQQLEGDKSMNYSLLIALGLLFLAASFLVTHSTGRTALVVLSCVAFLVAVILTVAGPAGVPGG